MKASAGILGAPMPRVDGRLKVSGSAPYPIDVAASNQAYAILVQSTVVRGRIRAVATDVAERAPGVVAIVTHVSTPKFPAGPMTPLGPSPLPPMQSADVAHYGQHVAMVIAETLEQAQAAASLIAITYEKAEPELSLDQASTAPESHPWLPDQARGDAAKAFASAEVRLDETYTTAGNTQNPIGLFAILAEWQGDTLIVHDTTQWPHGVKETLAGAFGLDPANVHVHTPYVGGVRREVGQETGQAGALARADVHVARTPPHERSASACRCLAGRTTDRDRARGEVATVHQRRLLQSGRRGNGGSVRLRTCNDAGPADSNECLITELDARARSRRRIVRAGVRD
jgi:CO/xanthine dehydrogenase Mo-binding subunit